MAEGLRLLGIFAHPDDEQAVGGTFARAAAEGVHVVITIATRGEAATIYAPQAATRQNLGQVRTQEMARAAAVLGVQDVRWLDWPDGGCNRLDSSKAIGQVVRLIRDVRPQVIITHPPHGGYPHPDHIAVYTYVREAFDAAADPKQYSEAGPAWAADRLFGRTIAESTFRQIPGYSEYRIRLNGAELPFYFTPDDQCVGAIDVPEYVDLKRESMSNHVTQINPDGIWAKIPEEISRRYQSREYMELLAVHGALPSDLPLKDVFAGLRTSSSIGGRG